MFDSIGREKSFKKAKKLKTKKISLKKVAFLCALLCLLFFEFGIVFGLSIGVGRDGQERRYFAKSAEEYAQALPLIQSAKAKSSTDNPLFASSISSEIPSNVVPKTLNVPILMYHHINTSWDTNDPNGFGLTVTPIQFEKQVSYLASNGYSTINLSDLYKALYQDGVLPEKPIILTFDDGYRDNYDYAYKILAKYGKKGTFFVISDAIGTNSYLTADQIKEMSDAGMDIQSHTKTHAELAKADIAKLTVELGIAKKEIEKLTEKPVYFIAYPFGQYNERTIRVAKSQGYLAGLSTAYDRIQDNAKMFDLKRVSIGPEVNIRSFAKLVAF